MNGDIHLNGIPLSRLSNESKNLLSSLLNTTKILKHLCPDRISRYRDWRGLASLVNISTQIEASIKEYPDRVGRVIEIWLQNDNNASVGQLLYYLQQLDRFDIYDDLLELARDNKLVAPPPNNELARIDAVEDDLITFQDVQHNSPQLYHAYVLFAPEDRAFVDTMLARLRDNGMKVCTEDDLLPGFATRYEPVTRLMSQRCRRVILVYSPDFFRSPASTFFMHIAQAHGIERDVRNLLPILYRPCDLPPEVSQYHKLLYSQRGDDTHQLFWRRLIDTLHHVRAPRLRNGAVSSSSSGVRIQEVPAITNGYIHTPITGNALSPEQASSCFTPHKEEQRVTLPDVPKSMGSGSITSLPSALRSAQTEVLPPYNLTDSISIPDLTGDVKSKKKSRVERFFNQFRSIPSKIGKKKKAIDVEG